MALFYQKFAVELPVLKHWILRCLPDVPDTGIRVDVTVRRMKTSQSDSQFMRATPPALPVISIPESTAVLEYLHVKVISGSLPRPISFEAVTSARPHHPWHTQATFHSEGPLSPYFSVRLYADTMFEQGLQLLRCSILMASTARAWQIPRFSNRHITLEATVPISRLGATSGVTPSLY
ncbi:hypothetical protein BC834DRAFT_166296 [Gloeopeniophorella convolvens]|nr:hypothetical protein BC834DRAFT_166296 [Gloeopeniophorella convolvens]